MSKLMSLCLLVLCSAFLTGCPKKLDCKYVKPITDTIAVSAATALTCQSAEPFKAGFIAYAEQMNICNAKKLSLSVEGPIADMLCPIMVNVLKGMTIAQINEKYPGANCTGDVAAMTVETLCKTIPY